MNHIQRKHPGQALITIVIFSLVLFLFVGLALDGGMLYLERRHLQNVVDAACLAASTEVGLGGTAGTATQKGQDYFAENLNSSARVAYNVTFPVVGSSLLPATAGQGQALTNGIEVVGQDVRVASTLPAFTYFMRLGGIPQYNVMARAHCGATQGGAILPIAVNRFPGYDSTGASTCNDKRLGIASTNQPLPQTYTKGKKLRFLRVRDVLQAAPNCGSGSGGTGVLNENTVNTSASWDCTSIRRQWYDWPTIDAATRKGPYHPPCVQSPSDPENSYVASEASPGYPLAMLGDGAQPNQGNTSFTGPVVLDIRNITTGPNYYNGISGATNVNVWKDLFEKYLYQGYPGPDVRPGEQISLLSGVSAGLIVQPVADKFKVGDKVWTLVYDGTVYRREDFMLSVTCKDGSFGCDTSTGATSRDQDTSPINTGTCRYDPKSFIADQSYGGYDTDNLASGTSLKPAEYTVTLSPNKTGTAASAIWLTARLSGINQTGSNSPGNPEGFGKLKFRWVGSDISGGKTGWLDGNTPVRVDMSGAGSTVTLQVIQTELQTPTACATAVGGYITLPKRVSGAHTIEVTGRSGNTQVLHSSYGLLGMNDNNTGNPFQTDDFFFSFQNDPATDFTSDAGAESVTTAFSSVIANSDKGDDNKLCGTPSAINWYRLDTTSGGLTSTSAPGGAAITFKTTGAGTTMTLAGTFSKAAGDVGVYAVDVQVKGVKSPSDDPCTSSSAFSKSSRFYVRVLDGLNPSVDEWVYALCYAQFKLTDITSNSVSGQAVSGCKRPEEVTKGMIGRLTPW